MRNNDQSIQNETDIKNDNNTKSKTIRKSQSKEKIEETYENKQEEFIGLIKEKLNIKKEEDFNEEIIPGVNNLIKEELNNILKKYAQEEYDDNISKIIQDTLNIDILKKAVLSTSDEINYVINSSKFKMLGNLHQQIMIGADNGNTVYNRFKIDNNILNDYKQYYKQLNDFIIDIIQDNYSSRINQIQSIILSIYNKIDNTNKLKDIDDIICFFFNDKIDSEKKIAR